MRLDLNYLGHSGVTQGPSGSSLSFAPNLARPRVFFDAELQKPLRFREAMSALHDVVVGAYSTLSSQVDLTGAVQVGECCFFGSGARVLPDITVGAEARIGAGAVVMRTVAAGAVMYAAPARKL